MALFVRYLFIALLVAFLGGTIVVFWQVENALPERQYSEFLSDIGNEQVEKIEIKGNRVTVTDINSFAYTFIAPDPGRLLDKLEGHPIGITVTTDRTPLFFQLLTIVIPISLIVIAWVALAKSRQTGTQEETEKTITSMRPDELLLTFEDVAGIDEAKQELVEVIDFLKNPEHFTTIGATIPKGILLQGPPGTGKTLLAKAIAGEAGVSFFSFSGSDFVEMFVGVGASRVRDLFRSAKKQAPAIIFIDEIDAVGGRRSGEASAGGQDERGQTLNALLVEMDGFGTTDTVVVLAATNRPDILDPALLRPGRFDRQINILPPDVKGRIKILKVHCKKVPLGQNVEIDQIAQATPGFTGAELANLVNEAALLAARNDKKEISMTDFELARDRVLLGVERKGMVMTEKDRRTLAYHEAGHAILARKLPEADPLHKITIIPRGLAMGQTQQIPLADRHAYSRNYLLSRITILMGGRAAEKLIFNEQTTGAQGDLLQATEIATNMITQWGMSESLGPQAYTKEGGGFLGGPGSLLALGDETARRIDEEVNLLLTTCYEKALAVLEEDKPFLQNLAEILLQTETLDSEELEIVFECTIKKEAKKGSGTVSKCSTCPAASNCAEAFKDVK